MSRIHVLFACPLNQNFGCRKTRLVALKFKAMATSKAEARPQAKAAREAEARPTPKAAREAKAEYVRKRDVM